MSTKQRLGHIHDRVRLSMMQRFTPKEADRISLVAVFHVEKLYNDVYHERLCTFLKRYRDLTSKRAVITCMTPLSPILAYEMKEAGFSAERYWERIAEAGQDAIVGLHGHFVRGPLDEGVRPMHHAFHDLDLIREQIGRELDALRAHGLISDQQLIYSGGWWFITPALRKILLGFGFQWDYSISSSQYNISPGSAAIQKYAGSETAQGARANPSSGRAIHSDIAVSGLARSGRPFQAISKILAEVPRRSSSRTHVSLYSHDYDLALAPALKMIEGFYIAGFRFHEPEPSSGLS